MQPPPPPPPPRADSATKPSQGADATPAPASQPAAASSVWPAAYQEPQQQQGLAGSSAWSAEQAVSSQDPVIQWAPPSNAGVDPSASSGADEAPRAAGALSRRASAAAAALTGPGQQQDVVVPAPKRTASLSKLPAVITSADERSALPAWQQLGSWGPSSLVSAAAAAASAPQADLPVSSESFHPFGEHPLQRALASNANQDPVVPAPARPQAKAVPQQPPPMAQPPVNQHLLDFSRTPAKKAPGQPAGPAATPALLQPSVAAMSSMAPMTSELLLQCSLGY